MEAFDNFGKEISILYNNKTKHKTAFGSCITIGLIIGLIIRISYLINIVISGQDPTILFQERDVENPKRFDINPNTFNIAIAIQGSDYNLQQDNDILMFDSFIETKIPVENSITGKTEYNWAKIPFKLENCNEDHIQIEDVKNYFQKSLSSHFCFPKNIPLHIEGEFNSDNFAQIIIQIKKCKGDKCKDNSVIENFLNQFFVEVVFTDVFFKPEIKEKPFQFFGRDIFWENSIKFPKKVYMELRNNYVESDFGLFLSDIKTDIYPSFQYADESIVNGSDEAFSTLIIRFQKRKENYYKRFYQKGVSIISEIGGFSQVLTAIGILLTSFYSSIHLNRQLVNNSFTFKQIKENKSQKEETLDIKNIKQINESVPKKLKNIDMNESQKNKKYTKDLKIDVNNFNQKKHSQNIEYSYPISQTETPNIKLQSNQNNECLSQSCKYKLKNFQYSYNNSNLKQIVKDMNEINVKTQTVFEKVKEYNEESQQSINSKVSDDKKVDLNNKISLDKNQYKFSIFEYVFSLIFKTRFLQRKKAIFDYSLKQINDQIDLQSIINKLYEIDKLKCILLNDDQLTLFNYLPKPSIQYSFQNEKTIFHESLNFLFFKKQKDHKENIQKATNSYRRIQSSSKEINYRLIKYLDEQDKQVFESSIKKDKQQLVSQSEQQQNFNSQNKLLSKKLVNQQSRNSITSVNEYFLDADQLDQNNLNDKVMKYSVFGPQTKIFKSQHFENETNRQFLQNSSKICKFQYDFFNKYLIIYYIILIILFINIQDHTY